MVAVGFFYCQGNDGRLVESISNRQLTFVSEPIGLVARVSLKETGQITFGARNQVSYRQASHLDHKTRTTNRAN